MRNFSAKSCANEKRRAKKSFDLLKLHLTHSPEKFNCYAVIKFHLHDFARKAQFEKGVILHGN